MYRQCNKRFREIIGKRALKNEELEKQQGDLKQRLNILECSMPAVMVWNIWRMSQGGSVPSLQRVVEKQFQGPASGEVYCPSTPSRHFDCRVREIEAERKQAEKRVEEARALWSEKMAVLEDKSRRLEEARKVQEETKQRIEQLSAEVKRLKEAASKVEDDGSCETGECAVIECKKKWLEKVPSNASIKSADVECLEKLEQLAENELAMKRQIADLERREEAYMRTLQQADDLWSKLQGDAASTTSALKEQLDMRTAANQRMADRICELEDIVEDLRTRLSTCRGELHKYLSVEKVEVLIGKDDDFADVLDAEVTCKSVMRDISVWMKQDMAEEEVLAVADLTDADMMFRPDMADLATGVIRSDLIATGDVQMAIHPDDFAYEDDRLLEASDYLARLGSLSELDKYGDDYLCAPDFACNDQVFTESGLTEEEWLALKEGRVTAKELLEKYADGADVAVAEIATPTKPVGIPAQMTRAAPSKEAIDAAVEEAEEAVTEEIVTIEAPFAEEEGVQEIETEKIAESDELMEEAMAAEMVVEEVEYVEDAEPMEEIRPVEDIAPVEDVKPVEDIGLVEDIKPVMDIGPVEDIKPVEDITPVEIIEPDKVITPGEDVRPAEADRPVEDVRPDETVRPVEDVRPAETVGPVEDVKPPEAVREEPAGVTEAAPEAVSRAQEDALDTKDIVVPRNEMLSWQDNVDSIRSTVAACSDCVVVKKDADKLATAMAAYTGVSIKVSTPLENLFSVVSYVQSEVRKETEVKEVTEQPKARAEVTPGMPEEGAKIEVQAKSEVVEAEDATVAKVEEKEVAAEVMAEPAAPEETKVEPPTTLSDAEEARRIGEMETSQDAVEEEPTTMPTIAEEAEEAEVPTEPMETPAVEDVREVAGLVDGEEVIPVEVEVKVEVEETKEGEPVIKEEPLEEEELAKEPEEEEITVPVDVEKEEEEEEKREVDVEVLEEPKEIKEEEEEEAEEVPSEFVFKMPEEVSEEGICTCLLPAPPRVPSKKIEITQTEITRIETIQVITQTVADVETQTAPRLSRQVPGPKFVTVTRAVDPDSATMNQLLLGKKPLNDKFSSMSVTGSSCALFTSLQQRPREAESHHCPLQEVLQSLRTHGAQMKADTEQELKQYPARFTGGLRMDQTGQQDTVCPECKIRKLQATLKAQDPLKKLSKKPTRDQQVSTCAATPEKLPISKLPPPTLKKRSDQGCMARIARVKAEAMPKKPFDDDSLHCACSGLIETKTPGKFKKIHCACGDPD
ncbi:Myosin light chain kinase, smooth muscle [Habropoda laboriosa]|uniref:Myosin light chain kinase, smooth muscle n=1 Tax=Habropoda laboriosa TaxID=597456 RepID=A0A0L7RAX1_9HYME|nr:Myosin light chain kinase, smooth muscle [Habropoda laboriosa]